MAVFSPSASAAPLSADVLGSWTGVYRDDLTAEAHGSGLPLESAVSLVEPCSVGDECGRQWAQGADASGREVGCGWAMTYIGLFFEESGLPQSAQSPWFAFREGPPQPFGSFKHCLTTGCTDYLRPAAGGNLEFKAICEGHVLGRGSPSLEVFGPVTMTPRFGTRS